MLKLLLYVGLYYPLSVGLTFYQKWFLKLRWLLPVGACASLDIGFSNWALQFLTVSLYTMAKSSSILFIVAFSLLLRLERWRPSLGAAATLIASGLVLFTWRAESVDVRGLALVELAALCTGVRWTVSQLLMQRCGDEQPSPLRHPLDMVAHVQPWMLMTILPVVFLVEGGSISADAITTFNGEHQPAFVGLLVLVGGLLAFLMEMSEYLLLVNTSSITLTLLGVVKEIITLLLAHYLHGDTVTGVNVIGLTLTLAGILIHGFSKQNAQRKLSSRSVPSVGGTNVGESSSIGSAHASMSGGGGERLDFDASVNGPRIGGVACDEHSKYHHHSDDRERLLSPHRMVTSNFNIVMLQFSRVISHFSRLVPYQRHFDTISMHSSGGVGGGSGSPPRSPRSPPRSPKPFAQL